MKSHDRMADVYNDANLQLRTDPKIILYKHNGKYARRELGWIYKQELTYFEKSVFLAGPARLQSIQRFCGYHHRQGPHTGDMPDCSVLSAVQGSP